jgi:hypothetical protein
MSTLPSGPVSTAMFPPEPSSTLTLFRNLWVTMGDAAALSLIRLTMPRASAKTSRGVSQPFVAAYVAPAMQHRQNCLRASKCCRVNRPARRERSRSADYAGRLSEARLPEKGVQPFHLVGRLFLRNYVHAVRHDTADHLVGDRGQLLQEQVFGQSASLGVFVQPPPVPVPSAINPIGAIVGEASIQAPGGPVYAATYSSRACRSISRLAKLGLVKNRSRYSPSRPSTKPLAVPGRYETRTTRAACP